VRGSVCCTCFIVMKLLFFDIAFVCALGGGGLLCFFWFCFLISCVLGCFVCVCLLCVFVFYLFSCVFLFVSFVCSLFFLLFFFFFYCLFSFLFVLFSLFSLSLFCDPFFFVFCSLCFLISFLWGGEMKERDHHRRAESLTQNSFNSCVPAPVVAPRTPKRAGVYLYL